MNRVSIPRLHSVQLKSGGAKVHVFRNATIEETISSYREANRDIENRRQDDITGYAIIAWADKGAVSVRTHAGDNRHVKHYEIPAFVHSILQGHVWDPD